MKANPEHRDKHKYCRFHRDHGHNIADCVDLKDEIKTLICKGHLRRYAKGERAARKEEREREQLNNTTEEPAEIRTISGAHPVEEIQTGLEKPTLGSLTFMEEDACRIQHSHDDAVVVTMTIVNRKVYRILDQHQKLDRRNLF
ncbi:uncharacterized protein LOC131255147 [Magnolia sinica]|uniref:uncharacterized protein LOC131255147 n=1 Tax=Magnolia sinica TaxID=86752 RepID=UPI00265A4F36|nr:uncharacterized protein LOC131255147 [Magnolia sinica]